jgi:1-aminocyclopropane-1-carboxylate deaminase
LISRLLYLPRVRLASFPTPLEKLERISSELGVNLYVKRDDVMELAFGGNKIRKLEFILADAKSKGANAIITRGAYHSNHARLTAAAGAKLGFEVYLVLYPPPEKPIVQGNLLPDYLLGAHVVYVSDSSEADEATEKLVKELEDKGRRPYIIPGGGTSPEGVYGYALAAPEILEQLQSYGVKPDYIIHATGTGTTQAGLILGAKLLGLEAHIIGVSVGRTANEVKKRIVDLIERAAEKLNLKIDVKPEDVTVYDRYTFGGYGVVTREVVEAMTYAARKEALILDPVYTGKAFYALLDLVRRGEIKESSNVVFIHTGGTPIPFQYVEKISTYPAESSSIRTP